jgi:hypothetical protein
MSCRRYALRGCEEGRDSKGMEAVVDFGEGILAGLFVGIEGFVRQCDDKISAGDF